MQTASSTTYCHLNTALRLFCLYYEDGAKLCPSLQLSWLSIMSLIAALWSDSDHGWEKDIKELVFLYWLAHTKSYRVVSLAFDIPKSSVHDRVSRGVIGILSRLITFPTADELEAAGAGFVRLPGFSAFHVVYVVSTGSCFTLFSCRQFTYHQGKFPNVFVGYLGSVHDARVLKYSPIFTGHL